MATHSSILAWRISWTEEPGGLHGIAQSWTQLSSEHTLSLECGNCRIVEKDYELFYYSIFLRIF